ncbi:hypothetical protein Y032_0270g840 [Ancylostoma ceylanicum]|uniref:Uncharacterized protein n=1 Tax=Ancylostoma ceylanicum TaxID=53326 RepID=A0A016S9J1_9BILA|nr:hypothetical protein Y032_0270g840 [Ancylostoma ceylanicum]
MTIESPAKNEMNILTCKMYRQTTVNCLVKHIVLPFVSLNTCKMYCQTHCLAICIAEQDLHSFFRKMYCQAKFYPVNYLAKHTLLPNVLSFNIRDWCPLTLVFNTTEP